MAKRIWPGTLEEQRDRDHVLALLGIVGRQQLYWSVDDVRRAMREMRHLALAYPAQLGRHIADLVPVTVLSVGQPMAGLTEEARAAKTRHLYVLTEREGETATTPPPLPDPMRVYVALWVACRAMGADAVETNAVTRVCSQIEALAVPDEPQMSTRLKALVERAAPLVEKRSGSRRGEERGSRWSRWKPLGAAPAHDQLDDWIEIMRHLEVDRRPTAMAGYVTLHEIARDLVELAIARTIPPKWPDGHPVTMTDLEAT